MAYSRVQYIGIMNLKIGLYALCAQQMLMDRNTCVIPVIKPITKDICMSKCGRNVLKTRRYDSVLSLLFLFFNLIKTVAKFMRTESVKCPAHAVFAKSRARHVHIMSLNLLTSQKSPLI